MRSAWIVADDPALIVVLPETVAVGDKTTFCVYVAEALQDDPVTRTVYWVVESGAGLMLLDVSPVDHR